MNKKEFYKLECKIIDNKIMNGQWEIDLPQDIQDRIYNCSKIVEIDTFQRFKKYLKTYE